jgi:anti-sigma factor RsiW
MTCGWVHRHLDSYLVGELAAPDRSQLEQHAAECVACAREMVREATLNHIVQMRFADDAWELDLWPGIRERIGPRRSVPRWRTAWWLGPAVAASLLGAVLLLAVVRREPPASISDPAAIAFASVSKAEREYSAAIRIADAEFERRKAGLPADTVASVEAAMKRVDLAIAVIHQEWRKAPDDAEVATWLEHAYAAKLDLLTR